MEVRHSQICSTSWKVWLFITEIAQEKMVAFSELAEASFIFIIWTDAFKTLIYVKNPLGDHAKMRVLI